MQIDYDYVVGDDSPQGLNEAMNVAMRHEFSHLRNNDPFISFAIPALISIGSTILGISIFSPMLTLALSTIAPHAAHVLYSRHMESRADDEAFERSTATELHYFDKLMLKGTLSNNQKLRTQGLMGQILFSPEGNERCRTLAHPSLTDRIAKLGKLY